MIPRINCLTLEPCAGVSVRRENDPPDRFHFRLTLQPVRGMAAVLYGIPMLPFVNGLPGRAEPLRQDRRRLIAGLDRPADLRPSPRAIVLEPVANNSALLGPMADNGSIIACL